MPQKTAVLTHIVHKLGSIRSMALRVLRQAEESARTHTELVDGVSILTEIVKTYPNFRKFRSLTSRLIESSLVSEEDSISITHMSNSIGVLHRALVALNTVLVRNYRPGNEDSELVHIEAKRNEDSPDDRAFRRTLNRRIQFAEIALGHTELNSAPQMINIDPSITCNFRCRICHHSIDQENKQQYLPTHIIEGLHDLLLRTDEVKLFGGGEPTLSPNLNKLCSAIHVTGVKADLLTNGSTIGKRALPLSQISNIGISFDGDNPRTFQAIRVNSDFNSILQRLEEFKVQFPESRLYFNVVVSRVNVDELAGITSIAASLGAQEVSFNKMIGFYDHTKKLELKREDIPLLEAQIKLSKEIGNAAGISVQSVILTDDLESEREPRSKENLLTELERQPTVENPKLPELTSALNSVKNAHSNLWSTLPQLLNELASEIRYEERYAEGPPATFGNQSSSLSSYLAFLEEMIADTPEEQLQIPYCTSTWVRTFIRADGTVRPCAMIQNHMGCITGDGSFKAVWNSPEYQELRKSHQGIGSLQQTCETCNFPERYLHIEGLCDYLSSLGKDVSRLNLPKNFMPAPNILNRLQKTPTEFISVESLPEALELDRGAVTRHQIALTFDGGGSNSFAPEICKILASQNVRATMFLTGEFIKRVPEHVRCILDHGHEIANHTMTHPALTEYDFGDTLEGITRKVVHRELVDTAETLKRVVGAKFAPLWRAPFGRRNEEVIAWARETGYHHVFWTIDTADWRVDLKDPLSMPGSVIAHTILRRSYADPSGLSGAVILCHLGAKRPVDPFYERLPALISFLKEMRYEFVTCSEMLKDRPQEKEFDQRSSVSLIIR